MIHEFKKSKDFPKACRVCEYGKKNPIHALPNPTEAGGRSTKQRKYQLRQREKGLCAMCPVKRVTKELCQKHREAHNARRRVKKEIGVMSQAGEESIIGINKKWYEAEGLTIKKMNKAIGKLKKDLEAGGECSCHCHRGCDGAFGGKRIGDAVIACLCHPMTCSHCTPKKEEEDSQVFVDMKPNSSKKIKIKVQPQTDKGRGWDGLRFHVKHMLLLSLANGIEYNKFTKKANEERLNELVDSIMERFISTLSRKEGE